MKKPLIVANWKSNPSSLSEAVTLARSAEAAFRMVQNVEVAVAPPALFLLKLKSVLKKVSLASQNSFWTGGPYTGEFSPRQLKAVGVRYGIVGHSERRMHLGETNDLIQKKVVALLSEGIHPILCVGERERRENDISPELGVELREGLKGVRGSQASRLVIAYEPVWAISTNPGARPDTPDNAFRVKLYIRKLLSDLFGRFTGEKIRILYGGSVSPLNVSLFLGEGQMEGALVGGASLDAKKFSDILKATGRQKKK